MDGRRGRTAIATFVTLILFAGLSGPPARAANLSITKTISLVDRGVSASFGLMLEYAPADALIRLGGRVSIAYAPGPLPATITVNVLTLLAANNPPISVPAWVTDFVNSTAAALGQSNPWTVRLPLTETPVGSYVVESFPIVAESGVGVFLDVTLNGQLNATVSTTAGALDRTAWIIGKWGGYEVNLTAPATAGVAVVTAAFEYYVSNNYTVRFNVLGIGGFGDYAFTYSVASFPVGEVSFNQSAVSTVEIVDTAGQSSLGVPVLPIAGALGGGLAVGIAAGYLAGVRRSAGRGKGSE